MPLSVCVCDMCVRKPWQALIKLKKAEKRKKSLQQISGMRKNKKTKPKCEAARWGHVRSNNKSQLESAEVAADAAVGCHWNAL